MYLVTGLSSTALHIDFYQSYTIAHFELPAMLRCQRMDGTTARL